MTVGFIKGASRSTKVLSNLTIPPDACMVRVESFHDDRKPARVEALLIVGEVELGGNDLQNIIRFLDKKIRRGQCPIDRKY